MERPPRRFGAAEALRLLQLDDSFAEDVNLMIYRTMAMLLWRQVEMSLLYREEPIIFEDNLWRDLQELPKENLVVLSDNEEESDDDSSITPNLVAPSGKRWNYVP